MDRQEREQKGVEYLERISSVYDNYIEQDQFPLDMSKLYFDANVYGSTELEILYNFDRGDYVNNTEPFPSSLIDDFHVIVENHWMYASRVSRVIAGPLIGRFSFQEQMLFPDKKTIETATDEEVGDMFSYFFEQFVRAKTGAGAEIITNICKRIILINEYCKYTNSEIEGEKESNNIASAFEISLNKIGGIYGIDKYEVRYIIKWNTWKTKRMFCYDKLFFDSFGNDSTSQEELIKYGEPTLDEFKKIYESNRWV